MIESLPNRKLVVGANDFAREWIVTNGLGGYSSTSIVGIPTRRYHGILVSALGPPYGRTVVFNHLAESLRVNSGLIMLSANEWNENGVVSADQKVAISFELDGGMPRWVFR